MHESDENESGSEEDDIALMAKRFKSFLRNKRNFGKKNFKVAFGENQRGERNKKESNHML